MKALEQEEGNILKRSRWQKIIKFRAKINKTEIQRAIQIINKTRSRLFEKNQQDR